MEQRLAELIRESIKMLYDYDADDKIIQVAETRKDFKGDFTLVVFPLLRISKKSPEQTAEEIGDYLKSHYSGIEAFNVIKGFLNIELSNSWWIRFFKHKKEEADCFSDSKIEKPETILVEYSSPNTNKPLHLGHVRNNLLGAAIYRILTACGHHVVRTNIVNDRGIHICKSMLAWQKYGNGETPSSTGMKGDHLVGKYYVIFEQKLKEQAKSLIDRGLPEDEARNNSPLMKEAREMLLKWEAGDKEVVDLWKTMNSWVYEGFDQTYKQLGVGFDKIYYESQTYKTGKEIVLSALKKNILYQNDDTSIWADLKDEGLDCKLLLRSDGTAVYMTQDLGTAVLRHEEYGFDKCIYVVGNEQNYHFQVLRTVLKKMGYSWADELYHFSYGMVELPDGKMKSREGTVVDADDLIVEMEETARKISLELGRGKIGEFSDDEKKDLFRKIGLGALKYFILKIDPKKNMLFNPAESIDFNGNTGPFIQYTYARIKSVFRKAEETGVPVESVITDNVAVNAKEIKLIKYIRRFGMVVKEAAHNLSPALIANYCYDLAKEYNQYYHDFSILGESDADIRNFRLELSRVIAATLKAGVELLGMEMPERM